MGMWKKSFTQHQIDQEDLKLGLIELQKFGTKGFTDSEGRYREIRPTAQLSLFGHNHIEWIPHLIAENNDEN